MPIQPSAPQPPLEPPLSALALGFELGLGRWEANKTIQENPETVLLRTSASRWGLQHVPREQPPPPRPKASILGFVHGKQRRSSLSSLILKTWHLGNLWWSWIEIWIGLVDRNREAPLEIMCIRSFLGTQTTRFISVDALLGEKKIEILFLQEPWRSLSSEYPILYGKGGWSKRRPKSEIKKKVAMAGKTDVGERGEGWSVTEDEGR